MPSPLIFKPPCYRRWSSIIAVDFDLQSTPIWETHNRNSKQNQNPHLIWERESEWEEERIEMRERKRIHHRRCSKPLCHRRWSSNHHTIVADLQSTLPILISNPHRFERPITKIQSKPKPTSNLRERIEMRERERIQHCRRSKPSRHCCCSKPPHHYCRSPIVVLRRDDGWLWWVLLGVCFRWENLFLSFLFFLVKLFLLQHNTSIYNKENLI